MMHETDLKLLNEPVKEFIFNSIRIPHFRLILRISFKVSNEK